jgi:hypothetical protein
MMSSSRWRQLVLLTLVFCLILVGTELLLRNVYGFTDAVLFKEDSELEYIPIPQSRYRFGQNIFYNSFSQRNREITPADSTIILVFGDSVINGGVLVDQDSLATTKLSNYLSNKYDYNILYTNISAPSWGPDNCFAYLNKYGNFGAKKILLVVSSHDAFDNMTFNKKVGIHRSYPNEQYRFALIELIARYLKPRYINPLIKKYGNISNTDRLGINKFKDGKEFNSGFKDFKKYSDSTQIPLLIYLHAEKGELKKGEYNDQGQKIIDFCESNDIPLIKGLDHNVQEDAYLDFIHLSMRGHHYMFEILKEYF